MYSPGVDPKVDVVIEECGGVSLNGVDKSFVWAVDMKVVGFWETDLSVNIADIDTAGVDIAGMDIADTIAGVDISGVDISGVDIAPDDISVVSRSVVVFKVVSCVVGTVIHEVATENIITKVNQNNTGTMVLYIF